jgi:predicted O-methyltransferase YrrM
MQQITLKSFVGRLRLSFYWRSSLLFSRFSLAKKRATDALEYQESKFTQLGCSRYEALQKLAELDKENFNSAEFADMHSEHEVILCALKLIGFNPKSILEIGTYKAETTLLLHRLFPSSKIETFDLPIDEAQKKRFYHYDQKLDSILEARTHNLSMASNTTYHEMSSVHLSKSSNSYDLIWIDGSHGYPVVTIDILNSFRLINDSGWVLCDDVFTNLKNSDSDKDSIATYETLLELQNIKSIELDFFYKRLSPESLVWKQRTKYLGLFQKV